MAAPTLRTVFGTAVYGDSTGASGVLTFTPQVLFVTSDTVVLPAPVRVIAGNGGTFTVDLAVTDGADYAPAGWVWQVVESWPGGRTFTFELPEDDGSDVNYVDLIPATSIADPYATHTHPQYLTADDLSGIVVTSVNGEAGVVVLDTDDIDEGATNLYFTDGRADARIAAASIDDLADVTAPAPATSDLLTWDGAAWVPTSTPTVDALQFDIAAGGEDPTTGQMLWNAEEGTVDLGLNGVNSTFIHLGQEMVYRIENQTAAPLPKGALIGFAGTVGNSGKLLGRLYDASVHPAKTVMGIAAESIPVGAQGYVVAFGKVRKVDTDVVGWSESDLLYADPATPGGLTNVAPQAPDAIVTVAALVTKSATVGELFVRPTFAPTLEETQDVLVTSPASGQVLVYDAVAGLWENVTLTAGDIGAYPDTNPDAFVDAAGAAAAAPVQSVNGNTGTVVLDASDVGAVPVSHLTDEDPHAQYLTETEGDLRYDALGAAASAQSAAASYTDSAVSALVDSAPTTLDTLNELASALGDDPNFATTVSTQIGEKADKTGNNTFTGAQTFVPADVAEIPVVVKGEAGQTANLMELRDSAEANRFSVNADGYVSALNVQAGSGIRVGTGVSYSTNQRWVSVQNAASIPATVSNGAILYVEAGVVKWLTPTGTVNTGDFVVTSDARLSDARTPTAHASSHASGGSDPVTPATIGAAPVRATLNAQTGTTYTLALADENRLVTLANAAAITVTVPAEASVAFPIGAKVDLAQTGAGQVTVAGDAGVTVQTSQTLALRAQWAGASLVKIGTDEWLLVGDLEAA